MRYFAPLDARVPGGGRSLDGRIVSCLATTTQHFVAPTRDSAMECASVVAPLATTPQFVAPLPSSALLWSLPQSQDHKTWRGLDPTPRNVFL